MLPLFAADAALAYLFLIFSAIICNIMNTRSFSDGRISHTTTITTSIHGDGLGNYECVCVRSFSFSGKFSFNINGNYGG